MFGAVYCIIAVSVLFKFPGISIAMFFLWILKICGSLVLNVLSDPTGQKAKRTIEVDAKSVGETLKGVQIETQDQPKPMVKNYDAKLRELKSQTEEVELMAQNSLGHHYDLKPVLDCPATWQEKIESDLRA